MDASDHARSQNARCWSLLEADERTSDDDLAMLEAAHASLTFWRMAGGPVEEQRGLWLIARVYSELGQGNLAASYAAACGAVTTTYPDVMKDFDFAYAAEALARAAAVSGETDAPELRASALDLARKVETQEDRRTLEADIASGNWGSLGPMATT